MLKFLSADRTLKGSAMAAVILFILVMLVINPRIDGSHGLGVIALQLAFVKSEGMRIVTGWGTTGIHRFQQWLWVDYLYAVAYGLFLTSLLARTARRHFVRPQVGARVLMLCPLLASSLDWMENSLELLFIQDPGAVSRLLFWCHSLLASIKWLLLPVVVTTLLVWRRPVGDLGAKSTPFETRHSD